MALDSAKRLATAVGEGAQVLRGLHRFLDEDKERRAAIDSAVRVRTAVG